MKNNGQVLLVAGLLLALIVAGMIIVMNGAGVNPHLPTVQNCVTVIYNSGVSEIVCK